MCEWRCMCVSPEIRKYPRTQCMIYEESIAPALSAWLERLRYFPPVAVHARPEACRATNFLGEDRGGGSRFYNAPAKGIRNLLWNPRGII